MSILSISFFITFLWVIIFYRDFKKAHEIVNQIYEVKNEITEEFESVEKKFIEWIKKEDDFFSLREDK